MSILQIVSVSGGVGRPSRTTQLADSISHALAARALGPVQIHKIELATLAPQYLGQLERKHLPNPAQFALERVEAADILIAATPVYRGAYTGLFKHFFDFVDHDALTDVPVILAATGGSYRHALVIDHSLRPLFSFFRAQSVPTQLYATAADFEGEQLADSDLRSRVELAAKQALGLAEVRRQQAHKPERTGTLAGVLNLDANVAQHAEHSARLAD